MRACEQSLWEIEKEVLGMLSSVFWLAWVRARWTPSVGGSNTGLRGMASALDRQERAKEDFQVGRDTRSQEVGQLQKARP